MKIGTNAVLVVTIILLMFGIACQEDRTLSGVPENCLDEGFRFTDKNLILNEGSTKEGLYLFQNVTNDKLLLNISPQKDPGAQAGWASELSAGKWSSIVINTENFEFSCYYLPSGGGTLDRNCRNVLKVCKIKDPVFSSQDSGSYWVSENKTLDSLIEAIKSRAISW